MAYSDNFPTQRAVFTLDAANAGRLDPRCSFSRASTGSYFGTAKHLASENLLTDSNGFPAYATNNVVTPSASGTFIDGTDAFVVTETTASGYHFINSTSGTITSGTSYTSTVFVKSGTASSIQLLYTAPLFGTGVYANYDLATPTNAPVTGADATASSTGLSDGWVKITLTGTATGSGSYPLLYLAFNNDDINSARLPTYTPASAKNFYVWEANVSTTGEKVLNQTSGSIHRQYAPTLQTAASGAARFEHSATDGQSAGTSLGILVESQTQNLNSYSEDFSHGNYNKYDGSLETNAAIAPDGSLTADLFVEDTGTSTHYISKAVSTGLSVGSTQYAISVFAKAAGRSQIQMYDNGQNTPGTTVFDLANGTVISGGGYIEACGNGWYRCTVIPTADYGTTGTPTIVLHNGSGTNYQGDGYSGVLLWGLQLETGNGSGTSHSSSYIGTTSSTVTRALDSMSVATADIGYTGGPVTIVGEVGGGYGASAIADLRNSSGSSDNYFLIWKASAAAVDSSAFAVYSKESGTLQTTQNITGSGGATKVAVCMDTNNISSCADGGTVTTDTSVVIPDGLNKLWIGNAYSGYQLNSNLKRIALYNEALSNSNLQALTS